MPKLLDGVEVGAPPDQTGKIIKGPLFRTKGLSAGKRQTQAHKYLCIKVYRRGVLIHTVGHGIHVYLLFIMFITAQSVQVVG